MYPWWAGLWAMEMDNGTGGQQPHPTLQGVRGALHYIGVLNLYQWTMENGDENTELHAVTSGRGAEA